MSKKLALATAVVLLSGILFTACDLINSETTPTPDPTPVTQANVIAEANLVPAENIQLSFLASGRVSEILVAEGDQVESGQILACLEDNEGIQAKVTSAESAVLQAQQQVDRLNENADLIAANSQVDLVKAKQNLLAAEQAWDAVDNDDFTEKLDDARVDMNQAEDDLNEAQGTLSEYDNLDEDNPIRTGYEEDVTQAQQTYDQAVWDYEALQYQYDLAQVQLNTAQKALEDAQQKVDSTQDGPDPDDLALANARLDEARSQLTAAQSALDELTLTAPMDGKIVHLDLTVGAQTAPGQLAVVLADFSPWYLETNDLTEDEVVSIEEGDEVSITFDAIPGETLSGVVESISDTFVERFGDITYTVKIRLDYMDPRLRWGMTAEVEFVN